MKYLTCFFLLIALTVSGQKLVGVPDDKNLNGNSKKLLKKGARFYKSESGKIEYEWGNGKSVLRFDRYGLRMIRRNYGPTDKALGIQPYDELILRDGDLNVHINLLDSMATFIQGPDWELHPNQRIDAQFQESGFKKIGSEDFLGKVCLIWEGKDALKNDQKKWIWRGIVLKENGSLDVAAQKIEENYVLNEAVFDVLNKVQFKSPTNN